MNNVNAEVLCLSLLTKCNTLKAATQLHAFACKTGLVDHPFLAGKILLRCAVAISGALPHARLLLRHFPNPDAFMYNTLIRGLSESETPVHALATFREMHRREALLFDSFTFAFALKAAANCGALRAGSQLHCRALVHGLDSHLFVATTLVSLYAECGVLELARKVFDGISEPNAVAWNAILTACFRCGDVGGGEAMFEQMPVRNSTSWNIVLAGCVAAGELERARTAFRKMPVRDEVSWSTMIVGFAQSGCLDDAFEFFKELCRTGLRPNEASLTGVLSACAQAGAFEFVRVVHCLVEKAGFMWMVAVNNALLDAYSKCGNVGLARLLFERMPEKKSIVSWSSMIYALAMHGFGEEAVELFDTMESFGIRPDEITYISILYSCSHAGLVQEGRRYFSKMIDNGIEPTLEHYGCIVDLYGRAGKLEKAYQFVCEMPVPPNAVIWRTLLGACSLHGNIELAERVKEKLSTLDPNNSGDHILLSNIYATAGKWKDVASVRRSMSEQRINKTPGWSVVEVNRLFYSFAASEKRNGAAAEAHEKLNEVMRRLRVEGGYVPEVGSVLYDIEDEEKEESVRRHSEKLAVAFGMARLQKGEVIRIVKNLRICGDCHTVMKLISKLYGLEIVVRDRSRFHSFREGSCSCGDYW